MKKISKVYIAAGVVAIVAVVVWAMSGGKKQEEVSFDTAKVAPANLMTSVTATGTIEPVTSVTVGTQVNVECGMVNGCGFAAIRNCSVLSFQF